MQLIDNWKQAWRFYSTHAYLITVAVGAGLAWLSKEYPAIYSEVPGWVMAIVGLFLSFTFAVSRLVKQDSSAPGNSDGQ